MRERPSLLNTALLIILFFIFSVTLTTTIIVKARGSDAIVRRVDNTQRVEQNDATASNKKFEKKFDSYELERIRAVTQEEDGKTSIVIITPYLYYTAGDTEFLEELKQKHSVLKNTVIKYFSSNTKTSLVELGDAKVKEQLLRELNLTLSLSEIKELYFSEYLFLE